MVQKPEIQYVGQFYVYGSEAVAPKAKKTVKELLPKEHKQKLHKVYIDPVALIGIVAAVTLLAALVLGGIRLNSMWEEHDAVASYLSSQKLDNSTLEHNYRTNLNLDDIRAKAEAMGLVPQEDVKTVYIRVTMPEPKPQRTLWDDIQWFFQGLFA